MLHFAYRLILTPGDIDAISWVAGRYDSARVLLGALDGPDHEDGGTYGIAEHDAWEYMDALASEDGDPLVPPCIGGDLASKLCSLYLEVV